MADTGPQGARSWTAPERSSNGASGDDELMLYNSFTDGKEIFVPHQSSSGPNGKKRILWYSCGPTVYDSAHLGHSRYLASLISEPARTDPFYRRELVFQDANTGTQQQGNYMTIDILRRVMEDYFDYDVNFVMNITDVDDKIVLRARRNYLLQQYKEEVSDVSKHTGGASALIRQISEEASQAVEESLKKQEEKCNEVRSELDSLRRSTSGVEGNEETPSENQLRKDKRTSKKSEEVENALREENFKLDRLRKARQALQGLKRPDQPSQEDVAEFVGRVVSIAGDEIAIWQDKLKGASVTDPEIYKRHAERYEAEFWEDMRRLGMRIPEEKNLTRVTEYMGEIIEYIQRIMDNGFAYTKDVSQETDNRSVYFDTQAYIESGHSYPKLSPWAGGCNALAAAGEANFVNADKRNGRDFALWKASKPGEPSWESPWGSGRPGWHIECSAMASKLLGNKMDIHTGGVDLRFPHHDNELAQAEAHYHEECGCSGQWVNYFLHSGHLNINGLKMSKSLKNFYTIREILDQSFSATQLRLMFALQPWNKEMNFVFSAKQALQKRENTFKHFFKNIGMLLPRENIQEEANGHSGEATFNASTRAALLDMSDLELVDTADQDLSAAITSTASQTHKALLDNINTGAAVDSLIDLVAATNKYMKQREESSTGNLSGTVAHAELLRRAAQFVQGMLEVLGITTIGLHLNEELSVSSKTLLDVFKRFRDCVASAPQLEEVCKSVDIEDKQLAEGQPAAILDALTDFRARVRTAAKKAKVVHALEECDRMRDSVMVDLGIRMEDKADGSSAWMADDAETLRQERREREDKARQEALVKAKKAVDVKKALLEKVEKQANQCTVQEALRNDYSRFTSEGQDANPTHDKDGNELEGGAVKKGKSKADSARKQRAFYDKQVSEKGAYYLEDLRTEVSQAIHEYEKLETEVKKLD